jgi:hypothetical protein
MPVLVIGIVTAWVNTRWQLETNGLPVRKCAGPGFDRGVLPDPCRPSAQASGLTVRQVRGLRTEADPRMSAFGYR